MMGLDDTQRSILIFVGVVSGSLFMMMMIGNATTVPPKGLHPVKVLDAFH